MFKIGDQLLVRSLTCQENDEHHGRKSIGYGCRQHELHLDGTHPWPHDSINKDSSSTRDRVHEIMAPGTSGIKAEGSGLQ